MASGLGIETVSTVYFVEGDYFDRNILDGMAGSTAWNYV